MGKMNRKSWLGVLRIVLMTFGVFCSIKGGYGEGEERKEVQYTSFEDAAKNMAADFESVEGTYDFTLLSDTKLTANVTIPAFVTTAHSGANPSTCSFSLFNNDSGINAGK